MCAAMRRSRCSLTGRESANETFLPGKEGRPSSFTEAFASWCGLVELLGHCHF